MLLAALVGLSGCLYLDGINEPPEVSVRLRTDIDLVYIGEEVWVDARDTSDPNGDALSYRFTLEHSGSGDDPAPELCQVSKQPWEYCFKPSAKVTYTVTLRVTDALGAVSYADPIEVHVNNREPQPECRFDTFPKPNNHFVVGREVWMTGVESSDPDEGDTLYYHWSERLRPLGSSTEDFVSQTSDINGEPTEDGASAIRLMVIPDVPGSYEFGLQVVDHSDPLDPENPPDVCQLFFEVDPDEEPCIAATAPDFGTGTLVFDRFDTRRLEVTQVTDDLDPYPGAGGETDFLWMVEEVPGAGFVEIPGYGFPYLDVEGQDYALNQRIRVRVVALDRATHDLSSCPVNLATCALRAGCFQWITWDIEFM